VPRTKKQGSGDAPTKRTRFKQEEYDWGGFIDARLTEEDKKMFADWHKQLGTAVWISFSDYLSGGLKASLSYDAQGDFFVATFTGAGIPLIGIDLRCCLTARAPEWETAVALLIFKHEVMAQKDWGTYKPKTNQFDRLG
jgi:hypothetical protein